MHPVQFAFSFFSNPGWSAQHSWERKTTFTKIHFLVSFHIVIQESLLSCSISRLVPNKDFLLCLVDQSLSGYMMAHHPNTFHDQRIALLWLHGSFSQYLYETLAETCSCTDWLCSPFPAIGSEMAQLTLRGFFFNSSRLKSRAQELLLFCKWMEFPRV